MTEQDFAKEGFCYQIGRPPARIDILMSIDGVKFTEAWPNRLRTDFDGAIAYVISRAHLIANKRAAGRPQDLIDADSLASAKQAITRNRPRPAKVSKKPKRRAGE